MAGAPDAAWAITGSSPLPKTYPKRMKDGQIVDVVAFFDTRDFDEFWNRVLPGP